ncbi:peptidase M48 [Pelagivirga sediminicola]|uniref:Peptidase M48 n=1 Tax=Pelagivirga sediminicola TaxID=2170575 RepID=A0A2T7G946_9RHOB|nr:M48 family metallopeptidase [Pelagivirga sediminicola]PVA10931.1 peptidase M48 [Pelagivirga sediminicola]
MLPVPARYYDGITATRQNVRAMLSEDGGALLILGGAQPAPLEWPLARLRAVGGAARKGHLVLALHDPANRADARPLAPARLTVTDPALIAALRARCHLARRDRRPGMRGRLVRRGALAAAAVGIMLFVILPRMADTLATLIPVEREITFGRSVVAQIERALGATDLGDLDCTAPAGTAALEVMTRRLSAGADLRYRLEVRVLDHAMVNAFAAPGGQIVIMRGLLDDATGPDAVAGVLAHEIAHVEARDATRHALRAAGSAGLLSMVIGDVTGGAAAVFLGERVMRASYTREAETGADRFALRMLNNAGVSSRGMAAFFDGLAEAEQEGGPGRLPTYLSSHPDSAARADVAEANAADQRATSPVISDAEWQALLAICD